MRNGDNKFYQFVLYWNCIKLKYAVQRCGIIIDFSESYLRGSEKSNERTKGGKQGAKLNL